MSNLNLLGGQVIVVSDIYTNELALLSILKDLNAEVIGTYKTVGMLRESDANKPNAIIIDQNITSSYVVLDEVIMGIDNNIKVVFFSDGLWINQENITFIHRAEKLILIKSYLYLGLTDGYGISPKLTAYTEFSLNGITTMEYFILKEWFLGRSVSDISMRCQKSAKTISLYKRNAMKKLRVNTDYELYLILKGLPVKN